MLRRFGRVGSDRSALFRISLIETILALMLMFAACSAVTAPEVAAPEPGRVFVKTRIDPRIRAAALAGGHPAPPDMRIKIHVYVTMLHEDEFDRISKETLDPNSASFGHTFTSRELVRYTRPRSDYEAVERWLTSYGINVLSIGSEPLGGTIRAEGTVSQIETVMNIRIDQSANREWFANMSNPQIPSNLKGLIAGFAGLDDLSGYTWGTSQIVQ
jgi:subtilase family serine protease